MAPAVAAARRGRRRLFLPRAAQGPRCGRPARWVPVHLRRAQRFGRRVLFRRRGVVRAGRPRVDAPHRPRAAPASPRPCGRVLRARDGCRVRLWGARRGELQHGSRSGRPLVVFPDPPGVDPPPAPTARALARAPVHVWPGRGAGGGGGGEGGGGHVVAAVFGGEGDGGARYGDAWAFSSRSGAWAPVTRGAVGAG